MQTSLVCVANFITTNNPLSSITVTTNGNGSVSPNLNGQLLEIGKSYTISATPATGYAFSNWTGGLTANTAQLTFVMQAKKGVVEGKIVNIRGLRIIKKKTNG